MAPHLVRAQSTYKDIRYTHFITHTYTHTTHTHNKPKSQQQMTGTNKYDTHALKKNYTAQHLISQAQDAQFTDGSVVPADLHTGLTLIHGRLLRQLCFAAAVPSYTDRA